MNSHDPLCPFIEDTDGIIYGWNSCECDLIAAVREDQNKVRPSGRLMYMSGYTDGEAHGYEKALDKVKQYALSLLNTELHLINEEIVVEAIVGYIDDSLIHG